MESEQITSQNSNPTNGNLNKTQSSSNSQSTQLTKEDEDVDYEKHIESMEELQSELEKLKQLLKEKTIGKPFLIQARKNVYS